MKTENNGKQMFNGLPICLPKKSYGPDDISDNNKSRLNSNGNTSQHKGISIQVRFKKFIFLLTFLAFKLLSS